MNWITKILKVGEKIKTVIKKRPSKEEIEIVIGLLAVKAQF